MASGRSICLCDSPVMIDHYSVMSLSKPPLNLAKQFAVEVSMGF
jgi:hypothetical protein